MAFIPAEVCMVPIATAGRGLLAEQDVQIGHCFSVLRH